MGVFERYLSLWVFLAIACGVLLGSLLPDVFALTAGLTLAEVNSPIALLIWVMIYPMMIQVDLSSLKRISAEPRGLLLTLVINWLIKPFSMALLGWLFFRVVFEALVTPEDAAQYIAGMILLGAAPCTAMVFVWSHLTKGDANYTLVQVSVNDVILVLAYAPLVALLLGVTDVTVPWDTLILSVVLYVVLPLIAGVLTRHVLIRKGGLESIHACVAALKPLSIVGLIGTVFILFGMQAQTMIEKPMVMLLIAVPLILQTVGIFAVSYWLAKRLHLPHRIAAPACMIGTSNFFELAVAVAISLFGLTSGAALATVVGVLVEVPIMLALVAFANRTRHWFQA